jgi:Sec-independent protein translocase protein TatA
MLALLGNLSLGEMVVIAIAAVLIFGKRLPDVATQGARHLRRLRRTLDDLRRETGIDRDLGEMRRTFDDAAREARLEDPMRSLPRSTATQPPEPPPAATSPAPPDEPDAREERPDLSGPRDLSG